MLTAKQSQPENNTASAKNNSPFFSQHMVQAKLEINEPGDRFEQEADAMADRVMRMSIPSMGASTFFSSAETGLQRKCQHCEEEEKLQRKESSDTAAQGSSELDSYVGSLGSSGQAIPESSRQFFEPRFGHDFSNVRIHTDSVAAKSAQSINALAYTSGNNIVFNSGQFSPESDSGKRLMAHELTHVVQQGSGVATKRIQRAGNPSDIPPMACDPANSSPSPSVLSSSFATSATELTPAQRADIANFAASWTASGGTDALRIDGYASTPGTDQLNWQLSCSRAISVANELRNNGVPDSMITIFAHGETSEFGSQLNNQVANISMSNPAPPPAPTPPPPPAPPVPATAAVFSEDPTEQFAGYDASVAPNWQVVPVGERRIARVTVTPAGSTPTFVSDTPGVATVTATATGISINGVSAGTANITAMAGTTVLATLQVSVKSQLARSVAFHYVCDSATAAAGGPHCSDLTPTADVMRALLNNVWQLQSNVMFTGGASNNVVAPGDLGTQVDDNGTGGGEMATVTALGSGVNYNVFRVGDLTSTVCGGDHRCNGGITNGSNTLIADTPCADGLGLPHEAGHFLGLGHGSGFIMNPCLTPRLNRRVSKAMTDIVNP